MATRGRSGPRASDRSGVKGCVGSESRTPGIADQASAVVVARRSSSCQLGGSVEVFVDEVGYALSLDERRRLLEANRAAAQFFRRELLRTRSTWPASYLDARGLPHVLTVESDWKVGYAPDTCSNLTDHLRAQGFDCGTLVKAGLVEWSDQGDAVDRHRDRLMLVARDHRLSPVGFVGIDETGRAQAATPATAIHRPTNVLVGIEEQLDLLGRGAVPVVVEHPVDAIAVTKLSREMG
ncbi:hypothetical protein E1261_12065, partial [Kribbella albertanoniae]